MVATFCSSCSPHWRPCECGWLLLPTNTHLGVFCGLESRWREGGQRWERQSSQNVSKLVYNVTACLKLSAAPGIITTLWQATVIGSIYKKFYDVIRNIRLCCCFFADGEDSRTDDVEL